jgi:hypothetical protein
MIRKTVFISCGQFTPQEKQLGKDIVALIRSSTELTPFFAEEVHDLNGLDSNILAALHDCVAFITVMHPRGEIIQPGGLKFVRASTWIEQEIAIATYIQRTEQRSLPIIAFIHKTIGLEGIRTLIHLNPIKFSNESEILAQLPTYLDQWKSLKPSGVELKMVSHVAKAESDHPIRKLEISLWNHTNKRISDYDIEVRMPSGILTHWAAHFPAERPCNEPGIRVFRFNHGDFGPIPPQDKMMNSISFDYCTYCAVKNYGDDPAIAAALISASPLAARAFVNGEEIRVEKTIKQLAVERE